MGLRIDARERITTTETTTAPPPAAPTGPGETRSDEPTTTAAPSVDAVRTSRAALRHDPSTAQFRHMLDQRLDESEAGFRPLTLELADAIPNLVGGSDGDDHFVVAQRSDGTVDVTNSATGDTHAYSADEADRGLVVGGGAGNDTFTVDGSVDDDIAIAIVGGDGDDTIDATGYGGDLLVDGGAGSDEILGGDGDDRLRGGDGDDVIRGGAGDDQVIGQGGDDQVFGDTGHDLVQGSEGADAVYGGTGGDAIYGDADDVIINAGNGAPIGERHANVSDGDVDTIIAEDGHGLVLGAGDEDVLATYDREATEAWLAEHPEFVIDGNEDFVERTVAELGALRGTEQGRGLLDELSVALDDAGDTLTFEERIGRPGGSYRRSDDAIEIGGHAAQYSAEGTNRHPLPVLFHELVHVYQDYVSGDVDGSTLHEDGSSTPNSELQATGLPWFDEHGDLHPANELLYTDNRFREELGLPLREGYGGVTSPIDGPDADAPPHDHDHG